ncbi:hypothetical protein J6590_024499 [Homalodisca vitripennis]|nr:hypothetical protein J6590_024499 [Homalodisca vitripennis]
MELTRLQPSNHFRPKESKRVNRKYAGGGEGVVGSRSSRLASLLVPIRAALVAALRNRSWVLYHLPLQHLDYGHLYPITRIFTNYYRKRKSFN